MRKEEKKYKLLKTYDSDICHATIYVPDRTPEEDAAQLERIKKATADFMKAVIAEQENKEAFKWKLTEVKKQSA